MATEVLMPKWGLTMKEGKVSKWFKAEGEAVQKGAPLFEVETSKITNTVETPADGILFQIVVSAGETVPVQTIVALIVQPGETPERITPGGRMEGTASAGKSTNVSENAQEKEFIPATPIARRLAKEWGISLSRVKGTGPSGRVTEEDVKKYQETAGAQAEPEPLADPKVMELAGRAGIDLSQVTGTGPGGKITKVDVLRAMSPVTQKKADVAKSSDSLHAAGSVIPMSGMRKIIADNMMASLHNAAQLTVFVEVDITQLTVFRDKVRKRYETDPSVKISYNDIISLAVCRALEDHPIINSHLTEEGIVLHSHVNLGVAVALPQGLVVPNVKAAHEKSLIALSSEIRRLAEMARKGGLTMDEIQGGTFTITNVSMLGVDGFTPILNPPETSILGVGRAVQKPGVHNGEISIRTFMTLSLTFDHRVADGAPAMRFLRTLADYLEDPVMLLA